MSARLTANQLIEKYQNDKKSTELIDRYEKLITTIAQLARGIYPKEDAWFRWFYGLFVNGRAVGDPVLRQVRSSINIVMRFASYRECYNQTVICFLQLAKRFKKYKKKTSFTKYIRMILGLQMRRYVNKYLNSPYTSTYINLIQSSEDFPAGSSFMPTVDCIEPFTMNLTWILYGSGATFSKLNAYQRYLLYLYFVENQSMREMAATTCQARNTVHRDFTSIIKKCKKLAIKEL